MACVRTSFQKIPGTQSTAKPKTSEEKPRCRRRCAHHVHRMYARCLRSRRASEVRARRLGCPRGGRDVGAARRYVRGWYGSRAGGLGWRMTVRRRPPSASARHWPSSNGHMRTSGHRTTSRRVASRRPWPLTPRAGVESRRTWQGAATETAGRRSAAKDRCRVLSTPRVRCSSVTDSCLVCAHVTPRASLCKHRPTPSVRPSELDRGWRRRRFGRG